METNYEELEEKVVDFTNSKHLEGRKGKVAGCDPDIGITIVDPESGAYILCLLGPSSPQIKVGKYTESGSYESLFEFLVGQIKSGTIDVMAVENVYKAAGKRSRIPRKNPSQETCAFGQ